MLSSTQHQLSKNWIVRLCFYRNTKTRRCLGFLCSTWRRLHFHVSSMSNRQKNAFFRHFNFLGYVIIPTCKMSENTGPVATSIKKKLSTHLEPTHLDIIDESHMHNVPVGSETHFKVVVISDKFADMTLLKVSSLIGFFHNFTVLSAA